MAPDAPSSPDQDEAPEQYQVSRPQSIKSNSPMKSNRPEYRTRLPYTLHIWLALSTITLCFGKPDSAGLLAPPAFPGAVVAQGDFNSDGQLDLIVSDPVGAFGTPVYTFYQGGDDGTFPVRTELTVPGVPGGTGDFNNDGKLDLLTYGTIESSAALGVMLGNGDGSFEMPELYPVSMGMTGQSITDMDGNGFVDVVSGNMIAFNEGNGVFNPLVKVIPTGHNQNLKSAVADFNRDTFPDIAVSNINQTIILSSDGNGEYYQGVALNGSSAKKVIAVDLNGDEKMDLLIAQIARVYRYLGNGDGTFSAESTMWSGSGLVDIFVGNLDGDDIPDVGLLRTSLDYGFRLSTEIVLFKGQGNGSFTFSQPSILIGDAGDPAEGSLWFGDYNSDNYPDLLSNYGGSANYAIITGNAEGLLDSSQSSVSVESLFNESLTRLNAVDIDGDGIVDVAHAGQEKAFLIYGKPGGGQLVTSIPVSGAHGNRGVAVDRINNDEINDLVIPTSTGVDVLLGEGNRTFGEPSQISTVAHTRTMVADLNEDLHNDVAGIGTTGLLTYLANGDGTFQEPQTWSTGEGPLAADAGDIDGDGHTDFFMSNEDDRTLAVLWGSGDGEFTPEVLPGLFGKVNDVAIVDVNGDGTSDLLALTPTTYVSSYSIPSPSRVYVMLSNGDRTYQIQVIYSVNADAIGMRLGDLNGDGFQDVVTLHKGTAEINVLWGNGDGTFREKVGYMAPSQTQGLALADVNGDNSLDIIASRYREILSIPNLCAFPPKQIVLSINLSGEGLQLTWPVAAKPDTMLQFTGDLGNWDWHDVSELAVQNGDHFEVSQPFTGEPVFFRLITP